MSRTASASASVPGRWLFRPASDLLWGSGLAYLFVFVLMLANIGFVLTYAPSWLVMFLVVLVSMPHYGATLLRAYERKEDRRAYRLFTTYSTLALAVFFLVGIRNLWAGSLLFTLYMTWSPWHYTAQNYGIALMFLKRGGIEVDERTRRFLRFSLTSSFVIAFLHIHSPALFTPFSGARVQFLSLRLPSMFVDVTMFSIILLYAVSTLLFLASVTKKGLRKAYPAIALLLVQAVWFVLPSIFRNWYPTSGPPVLGSRYVVYTFTWIALAHASQYLWITAYFARSTGRARSTASFYGRAVVCGCTLWALPLVLFAPGVLGRVPYDVGLAAVTAAVINLHHFILDGAVWKLRQPRVGGVLLNRDAGVERTLAPAPSPFVLLPRPLVALGVASVMLLLFGAVEEHGLSSRLRAGDTTGAARALERLAWIGRDSANTRAAIGALRMKEGDAVDAEHHLAIGVRIFPTAAGFIGLGEAQASQGKSRDSMQAFAQAIVLDPGNVMAKMLLALAHTDLGELDEAQALLKECPSRDDDTPPLRALRERIEGRLSD